MHSEQINELATALAKAQGQMRAASKDAVNPHLKNTYATLSSIIEAARESLSANCLAFSQILSQGDEGLILETILMHSSGQWLQSEVLIRVATDNRGINGAQALGSALTYYKRYALAALLGISVSDEDDDGNAAGQSTRKQPARQESQPQIMSRDSGPTQANLQQEQLAEAKKNGNGHDKKAADLPTQFWLTAKEMELTKEKAQAILKAAGSDFAVALDRLTGTAQPPVEAEA
jgi:hypothetical protein